MKALWEEGLANLTNDEVDISVVLQKERLDWRDRRFRGIYSARTAFETE